MSLNPEHHRSPTTFAKTFHSATQSANFLHRAFPPVTPHRSYRNQNENCCQLRNGLRTLLSAVTEKTGKPYDTAKLYVGTVHSLCQRLILDRRVSANRSRSKAPILLDELAQYLFLRRRRNWDAILQAAGFASSVDVLAIFDDHGTSRHKAITHLLSFFNRLSEEMIDPAAARKRTRDSSLRALLDGYETYRTLLRGNGIVSYTDLSLLQTVALEHLQRNKESGRVFRHVIVDEYQDTNPVQERIFLQLASGHKNLCVVGDDDQALYRFRGATVENFVEFPDRCQKHLATSPRRIVLGTNYRSREDIVGFYNRFIIHSPCNWLKGSKGAYRVMDKKITPHRKEKAVAVVASSPGAPEDVAEEIANLVRQLIDAKKVEDPNQIAFLFPSLKSPHVARIRDALANVNLEVYAPRAGQFLNVPESQAVFGLLFQALGSFTHVHTDFQKWLTIVEAQGAALMSHDAFLHRFIKQKQAETKQVTADYEILANVLNTRGWDTKDEYDPDSRAIGDIKRGTPIGNGLAWTLPRRVHLTTIYEIELHDRRWLGDKLVDRVAIRGRRAVGQGFQFELRGSPSSQSNIAVGICILGILAIIGALMATVVRRERTTLPIQEIQLS